MNTHPKPASVQLPQPELSRIDRLSPAPRNARTHSSKQLRQIAESIRAFGFTNPVLVDAAGQVIAGHGRLVAARSLGLAEVPTLRIDWLSPEQQRAYVIADNRLAEKAGWDRELLALELGELGALEIDVTLTGFDLREIELIIDAGDSPIGGDAVPDVAAGPAVCRPGELWQLGRHRLLCGDALDQASYSQLMGRERARLAVTDPPYNVPVQGMSPGLAKPATASSCKARASSAQASSPVSSKRRWPPWPRSAAMARCITCSWTGGTCPNCSARGRRSTTTG